MILINLNNQEMEIKYDVNIICELEARTGKGILALISSENMGFNMIRMLIWAGVKNKNERITPEIVGNWLQKEVDKGKNFAEIITEATGKVMEALKESGILGKLDEEEIEETKEDSPEGEINPVQ